MQEIRGLDLEVSRVCNLNCAECGRRYSSSFSGEDKKFLTPEDLLSYLEYLPKLPIVGMMGDGEPLLNPNFGELLNILSSHGIKVVLTSNGTLIDGEIVRGWKGKIDRIHVSLDSLNPERLDFLRSGSNLDQILAGLDLVRSEGIPLVINMLIFRGNIDEIVEVGGLCSLLGAKLILLVPIYYSDDLTGGFTSRPFTTPEEVALLDGSLKELDRLGIVHNKVSPYPKIESCPFEEWPYLTMDGLLYSCTIMAGRGYKDVYYMGEPTRVECDSFLVGNIKEGFDTLWMRERYGRSRNGRNRYCNVCLVRRGLACY